MSTLIRAKFGSLPGIHQLVDPLLGTDKAWSLATILKKISQTLNENRPACCAVFDNRDLIAQEFLLFENSGADDLEDFVDSQFARTRFRVKRRISNDAGRFMDLLILMAT